MSGKFFMFVFNILFNFPPCNLAEKPVSLGYFAVSVWVKVVRCKMYQMWEVRSPVWKWGWRFHYCATFQACQDLWSLLFPLPHTDPADIEAQKTLKMFPTESPPGLSWARRCKTWARLGFTVRVLGGKNWQLNTNSDFLAGKNKRPNINCNLRDLIVVMKGNKNKV